MQSKVEELSEVLVVKHGISTVRKFQETFIELSRKNVISPTDVRTLENSLQFFYETFNTFRGYFQNLRKCNKVSKNFSFLFLDMIVM